MIGQNSYSGTNNNSNNGTNPPSGPSIVASGASAPPAPAGTKKPLRKKLIVVLVGVVILAGLGTAAFFLFFNKSTGWFAPSDPTPTVTENNKLSISGNKTDQEIINQFDNAISSASNNEEALNSTFSKISFQIMSGEFETALTELNKLDTSSLSDYDQYRLHNYYVTVYKNLGNEAEAAKHQTLSDEAHARDLATFTLE